MRLKLYLKSEKEIFIPFNYNHIVSSMIYNKISDLELAKKLHESSSFKFFTFSQLNIRKRKMVKDWFISKNGEVSFQLASPDDYLIKSLIEGHLDDLKVNSEEKTFLWKK